jgi:menaquinone-dependent protoporphyrinogen IX oxidase
MDKDEWATIIVNSLADRGTACRIRPVKQLDVAPLVDTDATVISAAGKRGEKRSGLDECVCGSPEKRAKTSLPQKRLPH